jgi:predicted Fe-S protein YdhL (DUF1289 family)
VSAAELISPCIAVCVLDPADGYCRGCFRTIAEISAWLTLDAAAKHRLLAELGRRRERKSAVKSAP